MMRVVGSGRHGPGRETGLRRDEAGPVDQLSSVMANPQRWKRFEKLPDDVRDRLERLPELLARRPVLLAYVFGSRHRGDPLLVVLREGLRAIR